MIFDFNIEMSPGPPKGRVNLSSSSDEENDDSTDRMNKRKNISGAESPVNKKGKIPQIQDMSYDDPTMEQEERDQ